MSTTPPTVPDGSEPQAPRVLQMPVHGMTCQGCATTVER